MKANRKLYIVVAVLCAALWATAVLQVGHSRASSSARELYDADELTAVAGGSASGLHAAPAQVSQARGAPGAPPPRAGSIHPGAEADAGAAGSGSPEEGGDEQLGEPDEVMFAYDNRPEQREWRGTFHGEQHDPAWTERMNAQLQERAKQALAGQLRITESSCRQTLCRLMLQFDSERDAEAFQLAQHERGLHYEFQSLDPFHRGEGGDAGFAYELLVKRGELE